VNSFAARLLSRFKIKQTDIARRYLGVPEGQTIPISTLLIYVILKNEYPED
jgi:hypothetical protein